MPPPAHLSCWKDEGDEKLTRAEVTKLLQWVKKGCDKEQKEIYDFGHLIRMLEQVRAEGKKQKPVTARTSTGDDDAMDTQPE